MRTLAILLACCSVAWGAPPVNQWQAHLAKLRTLAATKITPDEERIYRKVQAIKKARWELQEEEWADIPAYEVQR